MPNPSKIYLASCAPENFGFLATNPSIQLITEPRDADLIIVDLANPVNPSKWVGDLPFILAAVGGPEDPKTLSAIKFFFPSHRSIKKASEELEEIISIVHQSRVARDQMVMHKMREEGSNG